MDKLDIFQSRFGKIDQFGWWNLDRISADVGTQFTSTEFKYEYQTRGVCLRLAASEHQEMIGKVEVTWKMLHTVTHSLMLHARAPEVYIHFFISVYNRSHLFGYTNQISYKQGW